MDANSGRSNAGVDSVESVPPYEATGDRSIRVRSVNKRHIKLLNDLQTELGGVGRREGIAALLEYYHRNPQKVLDEVRGPEFR